MPADDLSEDSDSSVLTDEFWRHDRSEDGEQIHQFSAPNPGVNGWLCLTSVQILHL